MNVYAIMQLAVDMELIEGQGETQSIRSEVVRLFREVSRDRGLSVLVGFRVDRMFVKQGAVFQREPGSSSFRKSIDAWVQAQQTVWSVFCTYTGCEDPDAYRKFLDRECARICDTYACAKTANPWVARAGSKQRQYRVSRYEAFLRSEYRPFTDDRSLPVLAYPFVWCRQFDDERLDRANLIAEISLHTDNGPVKPYVY